MLFRGPRVQILTASIIFRLGILQVRAQDFQDLIYKKGQAGITKASVQLIFNNEDKKNSPALYEGMDKIIVMREVWHI